MTMQMTPYPPAPWNSRGTMWIASLPTAGPIPVPDGITAIGGNRLVLMVVRYREGTLRYNELIVGSVVRHRGRVGIWVHAIWVDSQESLWGGRRIWGVPKELATFTWRDRGVVMRADNGLRIDLRFSGSPRWSARLPFIAPAFGVLGRRLQSFRGTGHGRLRLVKVRPLVWPAELPRLRAGTGDVPAVWLHDFRMVVHAPKELPHVVTEDQTLMEKKVP
jgi:hypothetical protein